MHKPYKWLLVVLVLLGTFEFGFSQNRRVVDSLKVLLNKVEKQKQSLNRKNTFTQDTALARLYQAMITAYWSTWSDSVLFYGKKCLLVSQKYNYKKGIASGYNAIGFYHLTHDSANLGWAYLRQALSIRREIKDYQGICRSLVIMGLYEQDTAKKLALLNEALKLAREKKLSEMEAAALHNMGKHYMGQNDLVKAMSCYLKSKSINERPEGNKVFLLNNLQEMGNIMATLKKLPEAREYLRQAIYWAEKNGETRKLIAAKFTLATAYPYEDHAKSIEIYKQTLELVRKINNERVMYQIYTNLGDLYYFAKSYQEALYYDTMTLRYYQGKQDKMQMAVCAVNTGMVYMQYRQYKKALEYELNAKEYLSGLNNLEVYMWIYKNLFEIYQYLGDHRKALESHIAYKSYYDSIYNVGKKDEILKLELKADFDKKEAESRAEQVRKELRHTMIRNSILTGLFGTLVFLVIVYRQRNKIKKERNRSDELLLNILPEEIAEELKSKGQTEARQFDEVTVLFTDFKGFTQISEKMTPQELVGEINTCFREFDFIISRYGIEKIKTIGDSYMAAGGLPVPSPTHAEDVINAAIEIQQFVELHNRKREEEGKPKFEIRIGIHSGPVVAGIVGVKKYAYDIWGDTVNTASRMESSGVEGRVNISEFTYQLVKDKFRCIPRGKIVAKHKGEIEMFFVEKFSDQPSPA